MTKYIVGAVDIEKDESGNLMNYRILNDNYICHENAPDKTIREYIFEKLTWLPLNSEIIHTTMVYDTESKMRYIFEFEYDMPYPGIWRCINNWVDTSNAYWWNEIQDMKNKLRVL